MRQATTTLHEGYDPVFERAIKSHIKHGDAWGYPTHILRHSMFDGKSQYNKISYLQLLLLNEMTKPYGQRAGWIVSVILLRSIFLARFVGMLMLAFEKLVRRRHHHSEP